MHDSLFSASNKSRLLAVESEERDKQTINRVSETLGFEVNFCKDDETALIKLQQRFFQIIVVNPKLTKQQVSTFIGNVRSIRGYERVPVLVLAESNVDNSAARFLDEGADGYVIKPFTEELLFSHLNLFLRRQIFRRFHQNEYLKRDLNTERGNIILCSTSKEILDIPVKGIEAEVLVVTNENELFKTLFSHNIWLVLMGVHAKWALPLVGKIKNDEAFNVQLILLRNNNVLDVEVVNFFNQGGDDITSVNKPAFILTQQINSRIERELYYKEKYVNALRTAASKLPIRSESKLNIHYGTWGISAFHEYHDQIPGGDFYEVIVINENQRVIIIGDVMGKKWDAWFFSLAYLGYIRSTLRNLAYQQFVDPAKLLNALNDSIFRDFKLSEVFTTLSAVLIDKENSTAQIASAGGLPVIHVQSKQVAFKTLHPKGTLLGLNENEVYENIQVTLETGDALYLFTDGYLESNANIEKMGQLLAANQDIKQAQAVDDIIKNESFYTSEDDRTMVRITLLSGDS